MRRIVLILSAAIFWAAPAHADQIDGGWCNEGKRLFIDGPQIDIPSGKRITGDYTRHSFRYTGPEGDPETGQEIRMVQRSDELMLLYRSTAPDNEERWHRCRVTS